MKRQRKTKSTFFNEMDITQALRGWAFEPGQVNVRIIRGNDGKAKLQLRLDLGLLQMELEGRPDGRRPHRTATELGFQQSRFQAHQEKYGNDAGFKLTARDCQSLREESAMFYHRYLSMFVLEQYLSVIRDTQHNIDVLDMCHRYGHSDYDRNCLEQYRPYILMMHTRAKACEALKQGYVRTATAYLRGGLKQIAHLMPREGRKNMLRQSNEGRVLVEMLKQIREHLPTDPREALQKRIREAVSRERYEEAAKLRDRLRAMIAAMAEPKMDASRAADATPGDAGLPPAMPAGRKPKARRTRNPQQKKVEGTGGGEGSQESGEH